MTTTIRLVTQCILVTLLHIADTLIFTVLRTGVLDNGLIYNQYTTDPALAILIIGTKLLLMLETVIESIIYVLLWTIKRIFLAYRLIDNVLSVEKALEEINAT